MAIAFVEGLSENTSANFASPTTAFNAVAGNLIVFAARYSWDSVHTISAVTDTAGNTYTRVGAAIGPISNVDTAEMWYCYNCIGNAANQISVAIGGGTATNCWFGHVQYSGIATASNPLDTNASGTETGSATTVTTGSYTTAQANEVIVNIATINATGDTITCTGFTNRAQDGSHVLVFFDNIVSAIQTGITTTTTSNNSRSWISIVGTFKDDGATPANTAGFFRLMG